MEVIFIMYVICFGKFHGMLGDMTNKTISGLLYHPV